MIEHRDESVISDRLLRRVERDRRARLEAEAIAERVTRELYTKQQELALLQQIATSANAASSLSQALEIALEAICVHTGWPVGHAFVRAADRPEELLSGGQWHLQDARRFAALRDVTELTRLRAGIGLPGRVLETRKPAWITDVLSDPNFPRARLAGEMGVRAAFAFPVLLGAEVMAVLEFFAVRPVEPDAALLELMEHVGRLLGRVVEREQAETRVYQQLDRLNALRTIDLAITGSQDIQVSLGVVADQARSQLAADATGILVHHPQLGRLEPIVSRGFRSRAYGQVTFGPHQGLPGRVTHTRTRLEWTADRDRALEEPDLRLLAEGFRQYRATPLIAKGSVCGVLEVFHRKPREMDESWLEYLDALGGQAAIAVDSIRMFQALESSRRELEVTYDQTLEGWVRALDLRDRETEGHTRRVTEVTVRLAVAAGITGEPLIQIRRGALLHDIGKMAIPDGILLKPGALNETERLEIERHTQYAHDFLWGIPYLRPALDIPYCHHERWDGAGYPRRLKREEIPLSARLFSVVDVWDALRSDRPYRNAWPEVDVLEYLSAQSGRQFDPKAVELFLRLRSE